MVIYVQDISKSADTTEQGSLVLCRLLQALDSSDQVTLSFAGVKTASASFVNVAFVGLLAKYPFDEIKRRLMVVDSTRQINEMIRRRLESSASVAA